MTDGGVIGKLKRQIDAGAAFSAWAGLNDPFVAETLAREAFDAVTLDMQHGGVDFLGAARSIQVVAAAGKPTVVRVPLGDFATASRLTDAGAAAVIAPMIDSAADARRFAEHMKFPPLGRRSWGPRAALSLSGLSLPDYLQAANGFTLAMAMVETREALAALEDILSTPGIDGVFIGPADLAIALSSGASADAHGAPVNAAVDHIVARARAQGKFAGLFCGDGARAKWAREHGVAFITVSSDQLAMRAGTRSELAIARG